MKNKSNILLFLVMLVAMSLLTGCSYKQKAILFKFEDKIDTQKQPIYKVSVDSVAMGSSHVPRIKIDDRIALRFLSNFSLEEGMAFGGLKLGEQETTFLVDEEGKVALPLLGRIAVAGLTRLECLEMLKVKYAEYLVDPNLDVLLYGRTITVMGEVIKQGVFELPDEKMTLIDALALANGLSKSAKISNVKIIRKLDNGQKEVLIFDLRKQTAMNTADLYVRDKDIIYVEPRNISSFANAISPYTGLIGIVTSLATISVLVVQLSRTVQ